LDILNKWIKVITHPLGLIGFALMIAYLVFLKNIDNSYISYIVLGCALISILAGFILGYNKTFCSENNTFVIKDNDNTVIRENEIKKPVDISNNKDSDISGNEIG